MIFILILNINMCTRYTLTDHRTPSELLFINREKDSDLLPTDNCNEIKIIAWTLFWEYINFNVITLKYENFFLKN